MDKQVWDIIIIGAGASGLMAAWELAQAGKKVLVIEARDRIGGRIYTINDNRFDKPVELGAEFIHGDLEYTLLLCKKAGVKKNQVKGEIWQKEDGKINEQEDFIDDYSALNKKFDELKHDISIEEFINNHLTEKKFEDLRFTLKNYIEGYYAGETSKASTFAVRDELNNSGDKQYRPEGGYSKLIEFLYEKCLETGVTILLDEPVIAIDYSKEPIKVTSFNDYFSHKVLITVPVGVLQKEEIIFTPSIAEKIIAAKKLGFGPVVKTILQFESAFWKNKEFTQQKNLDKLSFIFSESIIPTWWTQYPEHSNIITGWSGGPHALKLKDFTDEEIAGKAIISLSEIFEIDSKIIHQILKGWHVYNWVKDKFSYGGYSYEVVNGKEYREKVQEPLNNKIFFAGEGLYNGPEIGTVEAALSTGRETAHQIISLM